MLRGVLPSAPAPGVHFFASSPTEFVSFKPASGESIALSFKPDEKGAGLSLTVEERIGAAASRPASEKAGAVKFPDTAAGRVAAAYLKAFNSGDEKAMTEFLVTYLSKASQASRPMEERIKIYHRMRDDLGELQVESVSDDTERGLTVTMQAKEGGSVELRFEMDASEPQKLRGLRVERR